MLETQNCKNYHKTIWSDDGIALGRWFLIRFNWVTVWVVLFSSSSHRQWKVLKSKMRFVNLSGERRSFTVEVQRHLASHFACYTYEKLINLRITYVTDSFTRHRPFLSFIHSFILMLRAYGIKLKGFCASHHSVHRLIWNSVNFDETNAFSVGLNLWNAS